jgi:hypothetical protein
MLSVFGEPDGSQWIPSTIRGRGKDERQSQKSGSGGRHSDGKEVL